MSVGKMFAAKFSQVSPTSEVFEADKNLEMPFIGTVIAGIARGTLVNGTIFKREGYKPNAVYLCSNSEEEYDGEKRIVTNIISEVTNPLDILSLSERLGEGVLLRPKADEELDEAPAVRLGPRSCRE